MQLQTWTRLITTCSFILATYFSVDSLAADASAASVYLGIDSPTSSAGLNIPGAGHLYVVTYYSNGATQTYEAGPEILPSSGALIEKVYGENLSSPRVLLPVSAPSFDQTLSDGIYGYNQWPTIKLPRYYLGSQNSNSWAYALLEWAGLTTGQITGFVAQLQAASGLNAFAGNYTDAAPVVPFFKGPPPPPPGKGDCRCHPGHPCEFNPIHRVGLDERFVPYDITSNQAEHISYD